MDVVRSCRCCLRLVADKDLTTPYTHLGKTEIYADMLKECFNLHLWVNGSLFTGICSDCVSRLRDACDFKLQVQHSQVELLEQLKGSRLDGDEESLSKAEEEDGSEDGMLLTERKSKCAESTKWAYSVRLQRLPGLLGRRQGSPGRRQGSPGCLPGPPGRRQGPPGRLPGPPGRHQGSSDHYQCHDCGKSFKVKKALSRHVQYNCPTGALTAYNKKHRKCDLKLMDCSFCTYRSKNERNLYHHEMKHIGEKPYQCSDCDYKTGRKADFERHQSIHLGKKPYKCNFCKYRCIQKHTLLIHKRIHTGEKPYKCSSCGTRFSRVQCFRKHLRLHKRGVPLVPVQTKQMAKKSQLIFGSGGNFFASISS